LRICFIADARSPIVRNWIAHFIARPHEVQIISTYPCAADSFPGASMHHVPLAFSRLAGGARDGGQSGRPASPITTALRARRSGLLAGISLKAHLRITPVELHRHIEAAKSLLTQMAPDIVHAMRIPFEGILAAKAAPPQLPLLISVWGNDFTLCAPDNPMIARQTRQALGRADALHTDCRRDLAMAIEAWGFDAGKSATVLPGAGGIQMTRFNVGVPDESLRRQLNLSENAPVIINARGFRGYVRNDVFFAAIPMVLNKHPKAVFLCVAMQGNAMAEKRVKQFGIAANVRLLPQVARDEMAELFRLAQVAVSPSLHDGTPNTLLEAMACGCLPVAGRIESVCEWIDDGVNGLLCDATNVESLAGAMIRALDDEPLRQAARERNRQLIAERAEYNYVMQQAEAFYKEIIQRKHNAPTERAGR
jgi:glycosyltransferase involved in cell wall biosynthesis